MSTKKKVGALLTEPALRRKYPGSGTLKDIEIELDNTLRLPSRVLSFNHQLSGGIPYGHLMELYGEENIGKTLMAIDFGVTTQQLGGIVLWGDAEGTFDPRWAKQNGLILPRTELFASKAVEEISDWQADMIVHYRSKLVNNEPILLVIDSLAAMDTLENLDAAQSDAKAEMGTRAKAYDTLLRRRSGFYKKYGICVIYINQLRSKIGASQFEDPDVTPGGKAMRFYASLRLGLYGGALLKDDEKKRYGRIAYSRLKKTKVGAPTENIKLEVIFRQIDQRPVGYSRYAGFIETLTELGVIERKKGRYYYKEKQIAHGDERMLELLLTDVELRKRLIKRSGINTVTKTKAQLEKLETNLYPVNLRKSSSDE